MERALDVRVRVPLLGGVGQNGLLRRKWRKLLRHVRRELLHPRAYSHDALLYPVQRVRPKVYSALRLLWLRSDPVVEPRRYIYELWREFV